MAAVGAVMERRVTPRELRVLWQVLEWSFGLEREATQPFTVRDLAARTGMTPAGASRALNGLKVKHILRKNADGSWQFAPESSFHIWLVPWRVDDEEKRLAARRVDEAQGVEFRDQRPEVGGQSGAEENGDQKSEIGDQKTAGTQNENHQTKDTMNMKDENASNQEMHESHGGGSGDGVFLPTDVTNSVKSVSDAPLKSSPPSAMTPFNTIHNLLKGEPVVSLATQPEAERIEGNGTEAGMEKGSPIPEDPSAFDEKTLIRRLEGLLDKETMKKKGGRLRMFVRGSLDAGDCVDTAVAMRDAINEAEAAQREGRIKKSVFGYLWTKAFEFAALKGWRFDAATKSWVKGKPFNSWKLRKALLKSLAA
ncbi:MAG: helix-turn-helix domain-containing protein [Verrucomicrobiia bacterium]